MSAPQPIEARTDHELLELICEVEWSRMLHERVVKEDVLEALSARAELIERLVRWRWLVVEQVRAAGASWAEVDDAARVTSGEAKADYERVLARQRRFGLVGEDRADPGPREP